MELNFMLHFQEEMWLYDQTAFRVHPDIESLIAEEVAQVFGDDAAHSVRPRSVGRGANAEAIMLYVSVTLSATGGLPGVIQGVKYVAEKIQTLVQRLKRHSGYVRLPEKEAFLSCLTMVLQEDEIERIRLIQSERIVSGSGARLGDLPACYLFVIGLAGDIENGDDIHVVLTSEDGHILVHSHIKHQLVLGPYGDPGALEDFLGLGE